MLKGPTMLLVNTSRAVAALRCAGMAKALAEQLVAGASRTIPVDSHDGRDPAAGVHLRHEAR